MKIKTIIRKQEEFDKTVNNFLMLHKIKNVQTHIAGNDLIAVIQYE